MKLVNFALDPTQTFSLSWDEDTGSVQESDLIDSHVDYLNLAEVQGAPLVTDHVAVQKSAETVRLFAQMRISTLTMQPTGRINRTSFVISDGYGKPLNELNSKDWGSALSSLRPGQMLDTPFFEARSSSDFIDLEIHNLDSTGHPFHLVGLHLASP